MHGYTRVAYLVA